MARAASPSEGLQRGDEAAQSTAAVTEDGYPTKDLTAAVSLSTYQRLVELSRVKRQHVGKILDTLVQQTALHNTAQAPRLLRASYNPQPHMRDVPVDVLHTALLFIDVQNFNCHPDGALYLGSRAEEGTPYWWQQLAAAKPAWQALQDTCRNAGIEVMYTVIQALTSDCRDMSMDYKISGFNVPPMSFDCQVLDCIKPAADEMIIPKTSCSVFHGSNIGRILLNLGVRHLVLAGCLTDQCVESAARDACDSNFLVTLVSDACVTYSEERHKNALSTLKGFCRQRTSQQLIAEIEDIGSSS